MRYLFVIMGYFLHCCAPRQTSRCAAPCEFVKFGLRSAVADSCAPICFFDVFFRLFNMSFSNFSAKRIHDTAEMGRLLKSLSPTVLVLHVSSDVRRKLASHVFLQSVHVGDCVVGALQRLHRFTANGNSVGSGAEPMWPPRWM